MLNLFLTNLNYSKIVFPLMEKAGMSRNVGCVGLMIIAAFDHFQKTLSQSYYFIKVFLLFLCLFSRSRVALLNICIDTSKILEKYRNVLLAALLTKKIKGQQYSYI